MEILHIFEGILAYFLKERGCQQKNCVRWSFRYTDFISCHKFLLWRFTSL